MQNLAHVSAGSREDPNVGGAATGYNIADLAARSDASADASDGDSVEGVVNVTDVTGDDDRPFNLPHFDVVQSPPDDHHYLDTTDQGSAGRKRWVKTVQKEWKILENSLPDGIYVWAFEGRMDLLRVAMVGASGTPYQDGLFFFDMQLPPSYPAVPPQVYYHSFGLHLNPNLYPSGTVCLSLFNTFDGEGTEVWSPGTSSLLQVVVSLQALVLNDQPYYNEASFESLINTPEGHRNVFPYYENVFLLSSRTMLHLVRRPPQGFKGFVKDHFRRRGRYVLRMCEAYLKGCVPVEEGGMELPCWPASRSRLPMWCRGSWLPSQ
ncbi:probable ubiquitin-conjugating enzyme E2 23 [Triticum aestivum]|uniref:probable ubiquitin-conjugating enzyme E2 23 n=1 Tax=Triticum aestivum TaxID=4565 RepID=UPI001D009A03|nr:probable ubiquitin-conjugating enzyme E2 23 [Triticum aestivum]